MEGNLDRVFIPIEVDKLKAKAHYHSHLYRIVAFLLKSFLNKRGTRNPICFPVCSNLLVV